MIIPLETLSLVTFDKNNEKHITFLKRIINDESIKKRFTGFLSRLNSKANYGIIGKSFFVAENKELIGFIDIGLLNQEEEAVYLRGAIDKSKRGNNYGHKMLNEVSNYIFENYSNVKTIKLKIDKNNYASIKTAESCGFNYILNDYYIKSNPYLKKSHK